MVVVVVVGLLESSSGVKTGGVGMGVMAGGWERDGRPTLTIAGSSKLLGLTLGIDCASGWVAAWTAGWIAGLGAVFSLPASARSLMWLAWIVISVIYLPLLGQ